MDFNNFQSIAKVLVSEYHNKFLSEEHGTLEPKDIYVVWYCKTLGNAKALLSTPTSDGMYYEVTYNGDKDDIYFDAYKKQANITFKGSDFE